MQIQTDIDINNKKITNLANPVNDQDAVSPTHSLHSCPHAGLACRVATKLSHSCLSRASL